VSPRTTGDLPRQRVADQPAAASWLEVEAQGVTQGRGTVLGKPDDPPGPADKAAAVAQGGEQGGTQGSSQVMALFGPVSAEPQQRPTRRH
jgi:hypothetical protein